MDNKLAVRIVASVLFNQIKKQVSCDKMQYTFYGKCERCSNALDCQNLNLVIHSD